MTNDVTILIGDVRAKLREIADESVQCVVTSPPYWGLRDYGTEPQIWGGRADCGHEWGPVGKIHRGGPPGKSDALAGRDQSARAATGDIKTGCFCAHCGAWCGELGLEPTPALFVEHIVEVFREVKRVLRKDGTCWVNMGDCYAGGGRGPDTQSTLQGSRCNQERSREALKKLGGRKEPHGLKTKDLVGQPWLVAFGLRADGWYLRQDIIWAKPSPMPESIRDRCTKSHEYIFLLSKSERYYYNAEAIKEPVTGGAHARGQGNNRKVFPAGWASGPGSHSAVDHNKGARGEKPVRNTAWRVKQNESFSTAITHTVEKRNARSVWSIPTEPYPEAHYATFPTAIPRRAILAGTSAIGCCAKCHAPWRRLVAKKTHFEGGSGAAGATPEEVNGSGKWAGKQYGKNLKLGPVTTTTTTTTGYEPTCKCGCVERVPCVVLDPFGGSGTTGAVAKALGRDAILIDLNPANEPLMRARLAKGMIERKTKKPRKCDSLELPLEEVAGEGANK